MQATAGPSWRDLTARLLAGHDLTAAETAWAMGRVVAGEAPAVPLTGFLVALRAKGESVAELTGLADAMLEVAVPLDVPGRALDVVGTGGDMASTVNLSTMAALVAAGAGERVVKHGNRAASSACGTADVLEALGVRLDLPPARVAEVAVEVGITFCFAPVVHPSMRHAAPVRRELGLPTAFNLLGPLTNPARPAAAAVGVADARTAPLVAGVMAARGTDALVVRGGDGLDELTTTAPTTVWWVHAPEGGDDGTPRAVRELVVDAVDLGLPRSVPEDLRGGGPAENAAVVRDLLAGRPGPVRDAVLLNAAGALVAAEGGGGDLAGRLSAALGRAAASVDSGAAGDVLERWVAATSA
ncbi:anthranilate phosphoribosyltransferase [Pseudokineococcus lusitanus]|uniref:anthranilate phosphoribosyltransferase n=1 Tax=Pseudokineococcus lusitanus TaxID=763993 RepID=UPI001F540E70|nr:anthranilate phosphoribosyltransferase [Pseudokineococcus lusitanus]